MKHRLLIIVLLGMFLLGTICLVQAEPAPQGSASTAANPNRDIGGYWTRSPQTYDRTAPPCLECREPPSGYGFDLNVPPFTPEGQKRFDANKTGKGYAPDSKEAKANPQLHIGRRRGVPPAFANDPQSTCNPTGIPRLLVFTAAPFEFVVTQDRVLQFFEWTWSHREVWMDGRKLPEKIDYVPRWFGYSVGNWEGDTYVVRSIGFDDRSWIDIFGYPHSDQMKLEERYRLRDHNTLELIMTITDPVVYQKPWVGEPKVFKRLSRENLNIGGWAGLLEDICVPLDEVETFNRLARDPAGGVAH